MGRAKWKGDISIEVIAMFCDYQKRKKEDSKET